MKNIIVAGVAGIIGISIIGGLYYVLSQNEGEIKELKVDNTPISTKNLKDAKQTKSFVNMYGDNSELIPQSESTLPDGSKKSTISIQDIEAKIATTVDKSKKAQMAYNLGLNYLGKINDLNVQPNMDEAIKYLKIALDNNELNAGYELIQIYTDRHEPDTVMYYVNIMEELEPNKPTN